MSMGRVCRRFAPLLLLLFLAVDVGAGMYRDHRSLSYPQETHHDTYLMVSRLARVIEGWRPVESDCDIGLFCPYGFEERSTAPTSWVSRYRWLWTQGGVYANAYPLNALPAAALVALFPGSAAVAALGPRLWFACLLVACFLLGRLGRGPVTGLFAVLLACGTPGLFGAAMEHRDDIALAAIAAWIAVLLFATEGFSRLLPCLGVSALTMLAFRVSENVSGTLLVALTCAGPWLVAAQAGLAPGWRGDRRWRRLLGVATILAPAVLVLLFWPGRDGALQYMFFGAQLGDNGVPGTVDGNWVPEVAVLPRRLAYLEESARHLVLQPLVYLLWAGLIAAVSSGRRPAIAVAGMHLLPLLVLSLSVRVANWYLIPSLPGLVVAGAIGLALVPNRYLRALFCGAALTSAGVERFAATVAEVPRWTGDELVQPVIQGDKVLQYPRPDEGAAVAEISKVAREPRADGKPVRVLVLATMRTRGLRTCWVVEFDAPDATCYAPMYESDLRTPAVVLDPGRYDVLAWFERQGLFEMPMGESGPLPSMLLDAFNHMSPAQQVSQKLVEGLRRFRWETVHTPSGPVYRKIPGSGPVPGGG